MKRSIVLSLASLLTIFSFAQFTSNDALYIYRNDGKFNAFFYSEIDSITTSKSDELGNVFDEYKSQVVWTQDSVYWIPLEAIDSVSLCKPEKKYAQEVHLMDDLVPYITRVDGMNFQLSSSTPTKLIPAIGEVLLFEKYDTELFPLGFAGKVIESGLSVLCDSVSLEEVYNQLICIGNVSVNERRDNEKESRTSLMSASKIGVSGSVGLDFNVTKDVVGNDNAKIRLSATLKGKLGFDAKVVFKLVQNESLYCSVSGKSYVNGSFSCGAEGTIPKDFLKDVEPTLLFSAPIPSTPFLFKIKGRPSVKAELTANMSYSGGFESGTNWEASFVNGHLISSAKKGFQNCSKPELSGSLKGRIFLGYMLDYGIGSPGNFVSLTTENEVGGELSGEIPLDVLNPLYEGSRYELLRDKEVGLDLKLDLAIGGEMKFLAFKYKQRFPVLSLDMNIGTWKLVPTFTAPSVDYLESTQIITSVVPKERLLWPITVGLGLCNQEGELLTAKFCEDSYMLPESWPFEKFMATFDGLIPGSMYEAYPMIKIIGKEIKASPSTPFSTKFPPPAKVKKFEVNNATFVRDGFEYKDKTYYYDFAATTTVELEDSEGVEDWGYVYKDPEGEKVHISVKDLGTNADSRYDYYRTIPKSTVTLYGYAKYGEEKFAYEEPKEYPLEYTFHPTAFVGDVIADRTTTTSAQFEYRFDDVPRTGKCYVAYQAVDEDEPKIEQVSYTEKDTIKVSDLYPATTYNYWAYVEYAGETYMDLNGKKSFTTLTPSAYVKDVISGTITALSAQFEYGFSNVPDDGTCYIAIQADGVDEIETVPVSATDKDTYNVTNLQPDTKYSYWAYIEYNGKTYADFNGKKTFTTLAPTATTGESSNITHNSAIVECAFANVPEGGVCGVEYTWNGGSISKSVNITNGSIAISLSGLKSNTEYTYCAYVEVNGKTYYGADKTFTTLTGIPDLSGTWSCTTYNDDGSVLETATLTLTSDKRATSKTTSGSSFIPETETGSWSISSEGKVGIVFSWTGGSSYHPVWYSASFTGYVSSLSSPSSIEGTVYRAWASTSEHGNVYKFKMTR